VLNRLPMAPAPPEQAWPQAAGINADGGLGFR